MAGMVGMVDRVAVSAGPAGLEERQTQPRVMAHRPLRDSGFRVLCPPLAGVARPTGRAGGGILGKVPVAQERQKSIGTRNQLASVLVAKTG